MKTAANLHVQIPEKTPWLCRKKQGPALRKRVMERAMVAWALTRLISSVEEKKAGSTDLR